MSLQVNLIKENERRSGSSLNTKSFARIASIVVPVAVVILIAQQALSSFMLSSQLSILESQWSATEPKQKLAIKQTSRLNFNRTTLEQLESWAAARPLWNQLLAAIMQTVPESIKLRALRATLADKAPSTPSGGVMVRDYSLSLDGITHVRNSMQTVQTLQGNISRHPLLAPVVDSVVVANFAADEGSEDTLTRIFSIACEFKTLPAKETP